MVFHCFLIFLQKKNTYYAGIMLDAPSIVLCSKLCRHNVSDPNFGCVPERFLLSVRTNSITEKFVH